MLDSAPTAAVVGSADVATAHASAASRLTVRGLSHRFGERAVLDDVAFQVGAGEIFGLLGPNGSGKSTVLRVLTGLLQADAVQLSLDGESVEPGGRRLRACTGVVFQAPSLDQRLTARENLSLAGRLHSLSGSHLRDTVAGWLEFAQLSDRADEQVAQYSGGMKRRLELARSLMHEPRLLLMDEPTTGLDENSFRRTWERIETLRRERGLTVLFTTHRAEEAALCDRVAVIDAGKLVAADTPAALRSRVSGDILTLEAEQPQALCEELAERFELQPMLADGKVVIEVERGHELIPRVVEALPVGRIQTLSMHRPTLADVFVKLTGHSLGEDNPS